MPRIVVALSDGGSASGPPTGPPWGGGPTRAGSDESPEVIASVGARCWRTQASSRLGHDSLTACLSADRGRRRRDTAEAVIPERRLAPVQRRDPRPRRSGDAAIVRPLCPGADGSLL